MSEVQTAKRRKRDASAWEEELDEGEACEKGGARVKGGVQVKGAARCEGGNPVASEPSTVPPPKEVTPATPAKTTDTPRTELRKGSQRAPRAPVRGQMPAPAYELPSTYTTLSGLIDTRARAAALTTRAVPTAAPSWEVAQISKAVTQAGYKPDEIDLPGQDQYEYVFDEAMGIDFDEEPAAPQTNPDESAADVPETSNASGAESLPVYQHREALLAALTTHQTLIIVGETGSGKTTQLPQFLHHAGYSARGIIGCTQPRRVAAMSVATRVAEEMGSPVGEQVGYTIRFDDRTLPATVIKYMTDGMLLREFLTDPQLSAYSVIMIDEAHERTLSTDILLGLLKTITTTRPALKLLIASATMNAEKFSQFFAAPIFNIPGRRFPVTVHYTKQPEANYLHAAVTTIFQIHLSKPKGDILVFLTGQEEIEKVEQSLVEASGKLGGPLEVCPIYANLPADLQARIFEPTPVGSRKVVLATNIAETSITIPSIVYVVDPGFVKENMYNASSGMDSLVVIPCSKASADQRGGRAGRTGPGQCYRLYTRQAFLDLPANPTPEVLRTNLSSTVLLLLSLGVNDLLKFPFMDAPSAEALMKALESLYALGAMNSAGELTSLGRQMAEFPADPKLAKAVLQSAAHGVVTEVVTIVAMLGEASALFYRPKEHKEAADKVRESFAQAEGDPLTLLAVYEQWQAAGFSSQWCKDHFLQYRGMQRAKNVREQLIRLCRRVGVLGTLTGKAATTETALEHTGPAPPDPEQPRAVRIALALTSGFFANAAKLSPTGDGYKSLRKSQAVYIHPSSVLYRSKPPPRYVIYTELVLTSKEYMRNVLVIEEKWLKALAPHLYN